MDTELFLKIWIIFEDLKKLVRSILLHKISLFFFLFCFQCLWWEFYALIIDSSSVKRFWSMEALCLKYANELTYIYKDVLPVLSP